MTCRKIINQSGFTLIEIIATVVIFAVFSTIMLTLINAYRHGVGSLIISSGNVMRISKSSDLSNVMANIYADYRPYPIWKASIPYSSANPTNKILPTGMNGRFYICNAVTGDTKSGTSEPQPWQDIVNTQTPDGSVNWIPGMWQGNIPYAVGDIVIPTSNYIDPNTLKHGPNGHFYRCVTAGTSGLSEPALWFMTGSATVSDGTAQWKRLLGYLNLQIGTPDPVNKKTTIYGQYYVVENRFVKFDSNYIIQPIIAGVDAENVLEVKLQSVKKNPDGTERLGEQILTTLFTANESGQ